jgi:hypothetical protein
MDARNTRNLPKLLRAYAGNQAMLVVAANVSARTLAARGWN